MGVIPKPPQAAIGRKLLGCSIICSTPKNDSRFSFGSGFFSKLEQCLNDRGDVESTPSNDICGTSEKKEVNSSISEKMIDDKEMKN